MPAASMLVRKKIIEFTVIVLCKLIERMPHIFAKKIRKQKRRKQVNAYIVMQGKTYDQEKEAGIIWSQRLDQAGHLQHSWERMLEVKQDDLIFHYVSGEIVALSSATANGRESPLSVGLPNHPNGHHPGYLVPLDYHELEMPLSIAEHIETLAPFLPVKYSAFQANGQGNQGYLYPCNDELAIQLLEWISQANLYMPDEEQLSLSMDSIEINNENPLVPLLTKAESELKTKMRLGQKQFRKEIEAIWHHACPICGISLEDSIQASYAKPWKDSLHEERLDPYNGILLCCNHHSLYEKGFISFNAKGHILICEEMAETDYDPFLLNPDITIPTLAEHKPYFNWHKKHVFKG